jgi:D-glycero-D-manno-heptose 1,7-bisphosphate phosphatase
MSKALFLDRDGVINVEKNYVYKIEDFEFIDGIFEFVKKFQDKGYLVFVVTNQAGIGRGYYTEEDFRILTDWMNEEFKKQGIIINGVYYCPHHPTYGKGKYKKDCECRKPKPGMILKAKADFNIDLGKSILIGDKESDLEAGRKAGVGYLYRIDNHVFVDKENKHNDSRK